MSSLNTQNKEEDYIQLVWLVVESLQHLSVDHCRRIDISTVKYLYRIHTNTTYNAEICELHMQNVQNSPNAEAMLSISWDSTSNLLLFSLNRKVFAEVFRVLKPEGVFIVSFSNRFFYKKTISAWREGTDNNRVQLVVEYFQCVEGFIQPELVTKLGGNSQVDKSPWVMAMKLVGELMSRSDPFYAVIAYTNFRPIYK